MTIKEHDMEKLREMTKRLYDSKTPASVRRDLSMRVSILRQKIGATDVDTMLASHK